MCQPRCCRREVEHAHAGGLCGDQRAPVGGELDRVPVHAALERLGAGPVAEAAARRPVAPRQRAGAPVGDLRAALVAAPARRDSTASSGRRRPPETSSAPSQATLRASPAAGQRVAVRSSAAHVPEPDRAVRRGARRGAAESGLNAAFAPPSGVVASSPIRHSAPPATYRRSGLSVADRASAAGTRSERTAASSPSPRSSGGRRGSRPACVPARRSGRRRRARPLARQGLLVERAALRRPNAQLARAGAGEQRAVRAERERR